MIELERTYLAKYLPADLSKCPKKEILDLYFPANVAHPVLRLRKKWNLYDFTKKFPVEDGDVSAQHEFTISLDESEYSLFAQMQWKRVHKMRYYYDYQGITAEFDVFLWGLAGLIVIDFEFGSEDVKNDFKMPDFCLIEITQEKFVAGWMICGKEYSDVEESLAQFSYQKLYLE